MERHCPNLCYRRVHAELSQWECALSYFISHLRFLRRNGAETRNDEITMTLIGARRARFLLSSLSFHSGEKQLAAREAEILRPYFLEAHLPSERKYVLPCYCAACPLIYCVAPVRRLTLLVIGGTRLRVPEHKTGGSGAISPRLRAAGPSFCCVGSLSPCARLYGDYMWC